ncbi:MAG: PhzF family phenazine biosynthesis protein [Blastocatellia bacterium]|nr:PhzF family phenazine biosynthesis protein [Blastocatellia bacterium]
MSRINVQIVNAFVDAGQGGNPAGVVLDAERFSQVEKQKIAALVGLSETAFVSPSQTAAFKLEFFTPNRQIPHCGHATVGTFSYLVQLEKVTGSHSSKETIEGNRDIFLSDGMAFLEQQAPRYTVIQAETQPVSEAAVLESLGITAAELLDGHHPTIVNTGVNFLLIPLRNEAALVRVTPHLEQIEHISERLDLIGYYAFSQDVRKPGRDAGARMFAPRFGISEESATGMAAGPLGCYLYDFLGVKKEKLVLEQGHLMKKPSPSELNVHLTLEDGRIARLMVGGRATVSHVMEVEI